MGNLINIFDFKRPSLWAISLCIPILMVTLIANIICIYIVVLKRLLINFNITPTYYSSTLCKWEIYVYYTSLSTSKCLMVRFCADRYIASSNNVLIQRYSSQHMHVRIILFLLIFFLFLNTKVFHFFDANRSNTPALCYPKETTCVLLDSCLFFVCQCADSPVHMLVFRFSIFVHI